MDLAVMARVLLRFKLLVAFGVLLATSLAILSYATPSFSGGFKLKYRSYESWSSYAQLIVSQKGFTWGSTLANSTDDAAVEAQRTAEGRLVTLATIYSKYAVGDDVKALVRSRTRVRGPWDASPVQAARNSDAYLPMIVITAYARTGPESRQLANVVSSSLTKYIEDRQASANPPITPDDRVKLQVLSRGGHTVLASPRSKTLPVVIFAVLMAAVIFLAFVLENLRPRVTPDAQSATGESEGASEQPAILFQDAAAG